LDETPDPLTRPRLLEAAVEIMLAAGDTAAAARAAAELSDIAERFRAPLLEAMAARARGAVHLASNEGHEALVALRAALRGWQAVEAPYDAARTRVLIGLACRELDDEDAAEMQFDAARLTFGQLGARPDLDRLDAAAGRSSKDYVGGLTSRELEVLRLVAAGKTNRTIAVDLVISEKTVARHVSNIFTKLGLSSRAGATAFAYEHELV
jgi:DNA-binding NarL/FixJ family response regulator